MNPGWLIALLPLTLSLYFASLIGRVSTGEVITASYAWVPSFGINLTFYVDGLSLVFALLISGHLIFQTVDVGPQVCMMFFIALTLFLLSTLKKPAIIFATLIPLQILWTNMHGTFLFGPIIAALTAFQASQGPKSRTKNQAAQPGIYGILAAAMLVATIANPAL